MIHAESRQAAEDVWFAVCEINISNGKWKLLTTSPDRDRLSRFARTMNDTERNPYVLYRTVDYATAVERICAS